MAQTGEEKVTPSANAKPKIEEGKLAPAFSVLDMNGQRQELSQFVGKKNLLLTFFPKCFTGGCTNHLTSIRDVYSQLQASGTEVLAVSVDPADGEQGQKAFAAKWNLPFPLIPDTSRDLSILYGATRKPTELAARQSILIDKKGVIRWVDRQVNVNTHGADIVEKLKELGIDKIDRQESQK